MTDKPESFPSGPINSALPSALIPKQSRSIRTRLMAAFMLLVFFSVMAVGILAILLSARNAQNALFNQLETLSALKEIEVRGWLSNLNIGLVSALPSADEMILFEVLLQTERSQVTSTWSQTHDRILQNYQELIQRSDYFEELFIMDLSGEVVLTTNPEQSFMIRKGRDYFEEGLKGYYQGVLYFAPSLQRMSMVVSAPITALEGERLGVLAGRVNLNYLNSLVIQTAGLGQTGETYLVTKDHVLMSASRFEDQGWLTYESPVFSAGINAAVEKQQTGQGLYLGYRGTPVIGNYLWLPELKVAILSEQEQAEALRPINQTILATAFLMVGGLAIAFLVGLIATNRITRPLAGLAQVAEQIAAGDLELRSEVAQMDEIGALARSFNTMTTQLQSLVVGLEQRVEQRTRDLERRSNQLQIAAEVARDATGIRDLQELLKRGVDLVRSRFDYYHAGIFLVDEQGEYAVLAAASGDAGRQMLLRGHRLKVGERGMVGYVTRSGQPRIAADVRTDPTHYVNPLLPETRSEAVLPLRVGNRIIGALDVQSTQLDAFDEDTVNILFIVADQLAVAIESARLLQQTQRTLQELEAVYSTYTRQSWQPSQQISQSHFDLSTMGSTSSRLRKIGMPAGYRYRGLDVEPLVASEDGLHEDSPSEARGISAGSLEEQAQDTLNIPLKLRDQQIGMLELKIASGALNPEIQATYEEMASRLALLLENARLLNEARRLAVREQQINLISSQVRSAVSMDAILQNTVRELGKAFGAAHTFIQLGALQPDAERSRSATPITEEPIAGDGAAHNSEQSGSPAADAPEVQHE